MRPLRLRVENLTAFRGEQPVLDLGDYDRFAISGPTGSGKTSLLDAILIALYGEVPRTGNSLKELISQGRDRMCVRLDFAVGGSAYRVTRAVYANTRPTQAILERLVDGDEPAAVQDGVNAVGAEIQRLVGLNYDAFTQAVILPQGKFDLFLHSKPSERNDILKELLRLQVYERMRARAEAESKASDAAVKMLSQMLEQTYAGVTPQALVDVSRELGRASEANAALTKKAEQLTAAAEALRAHAVKVRDLVDERGKLGDLDARKGAIEKDQAALELARRADVVVPQLESAERARADAERARMALTAAEQTTRTVGAERQTAKERMATASKAAARIPELDARTEALGRAAALAGPIAGARRRVESAKERVAKKKRESEKAAAAQATAIESVERAHRETKAREAKEKAARARFEAVTTALGEAKAAREAGARANVVAHLRHGLGPGDPCPICERPLATAPSKGAGSDEAALVEAVSKAEAELSQLRDSHEGTRSGLEDARRAHERALVEADAAAKAAASAVARLGEASADLERAVGEQASLQAQLQQLTTEPDPSHAQNQLRQEKELYARDLAEAQRGESTTAATLAAAQAAAEAAKSRLREALESAVREDERVAKALAEAGFATAKAARAARLSASQQAALSKAVDDWRRQRHAAAERASVLEAALGKKARDAKALTTIEGQLEQAERELAECRQKRDDGLQQESRLDQQRRDLERRLAEADSKRKELETARAQLGPLRQLSLDLRSNQFQAYLLDETFRELVAGASQQLLALSGRYEFEYEKDAFFVLDHDNASERRRVETLSGGETFLASLALALELSQQVQRAAGAVDIGSLFIDEGFGTLDAESLRIVADAVENLPTAGRMVGIITHLPELTALLPVCIQIEKGPDGSRLAVRAA